MGHFLADINVIVGAFVLDHHMYGASLHKSYADAPLLSLGEGLFDEIARINLMRDAWVLRTKHETDRQLQLADRS